MGVEIDEKVDAFLEHYGVRGMQWGVRRTRRPGSFGKTAPRSQNSDNEKSHRGRNIALGVAAGIAVGLIIRRNRNIKLAQLNHSNDRLRQMSEAYKTFQAKKSAGQAYMQARSGAYKAMHMGPIGSTGVARLGGAIPMPKIGG